MTRPQMTQLARAFGLDVVSGTGDKAVCRCPNPTHLDRNPSCSCFFGRNGEPRLHCHACGYSRSFAEHCAAVTPGFSKMAGAKHVLKVALSLQPFDQTSGELGLADVRRDTCASSIVEELVVELSPAGAVEDTYNYLFRRGLTPNDDLGGLPEGQHRTALAEQIRDIVGEEVWAASPLTTDGDFADPDHRLIIAYREPDGSVSGVTRRVLADDLKQPRYKLPHGTALRWPFGTSRVVAACHPETVIVEGALDVLAYEKLKGAQNRVLGVPSANSWRDEWCYLLGRRVVLALDDDDAGRRAAARIAASVRKHRPEVEITWDTPVHGKDWGDEVLHVA